MIYAIAEIDDTSVIKIGYTRTRNDAVVPSAADGRLSALQTGAWRELGVVALSPGDAMHERELHVRFSVHHVRGEWFRNRGIVADWVSRWRYPATEPTKEDIKRRERSERARKAMHRKSMQTQAMSIVSTRSLGLSEAELEEWMQESMRAAGLS